PVVGVGAVILDAGKILLEKRKNQPGRGKWTIPGGLVDLGEQLEHSVVREVEEETCLECMKDETPRLIDVVDDIDLDEKGEVKYHFVIIDYFVKVKNNVFKAASDAEELRWVSLDAVEGYDLTSSFRVFFMRNRQNWNDTNSPL
ncbi:NUDIX domain-containing protein, partial [Candidatus Bathyarchaeota archaeon]